MTTSARNRIRFSIRKYLCRDYQRKAFSLVELLVIEGIIILLIALLLPTLAKARRHANDLKCAVQLRQIGIALTNYATLNSGDYPTFSTKWQIYHGEGVSPDEPGLGWTELLDPFLPGGEKNYDCPAFPTGIPFNYFLASRWTYLHNRSCMHLAEIRRSSEFFVAAETLTIHAYPKPFGDNTNTTNDCDKDDALGPLLYFFGFGDAFNAHGDGTHLLFADGHVAAFKQFDPAQITCDPQHEGRSWDQIVRP